MFTPAVTIYAPPPAHYSAAGIAVENVPFAAIPAVCAALGAVGPVYQGQSGRYMLGCQHAATIILPTLATWPFDAPCYAVNIRHELAHAVGWPADHARGSVYVCHPK